MNLFFKPRFWIFKRSIRSAPRWQIALIIVIAGAGIILLSLKIVDLMHLFRSTQSLKIFGWLVGLTGLGIGLTCVLVLTNALHEFFRCPDISPFLISGFNPRLYLLGKFFYLFGVGLVASIPTFLASIGFILVNDGINGFSNAFLPVITLNAIIVTFISFILFSLALLFGREHIDLAAGILVLSCAVISIAFLDHVSHLPGILLRINKFVLSLATTPMYQIILILVLSLVAYLGVDAIFFRVQTGDGLLEDVFYRRLKNRGAGKPRTVRPTNVLGMGLVRKDLSILTRAPSILLNILLLVLLVSLFPIQNHNKGNSAGIFWIIWLMNIILSPVLAGVASHIVLIDETCFAWIKLGGVRTHKWLTDKLVVALITFLPVWIASCIGLAFSGLTGIQKLIVFFSASLAYTLNLVFGGLIAGAYGSFSSRKLNFAGTAAMIVVGFFVGVFCVVCPIALWGNTVNVLAQGLGFMDMIFPSLHITESQRLFVNYACIIGVFIPLALTLFAKVAYFRLERYEVD